MHSVQPIQLLSTYTDGNSICSKIIEPEGHASIQQILQIWHSFEREYLLVIKALF